MSDNDYDAVRFLHDARIYLHNAQHCLNSPPQSLNQALKLVTQALDDRRFYVSVATDDAWIGSDGMYIDYGTFDGCVGGGERLSHYVRPLPSTVDDFVSVLADIVEALPLGAEEER